MNIWLKILLGENFVLISIFLLQNYILDKGLKKKIAEIDWEHRYVYNPKTKSKIKK